MYQTGPPSVGLLAEPMLVINQKLKLIELKNEFKIFDQHGQQVGAAIQARQSPLAFLARIFSDLDVALPMTLEVRDRSGGLALTLHKPWFRMACSVTRGDGMELGTIRKRIRLGKARFSLLDPGGRDVGEVRAHNWRAKDFSVLDASGQELARVNKKWAGLRELFTDADNYVIQLNPAAPDPMRGLAVASVLAIDTVMKQKDSG
ncbi:MAG TPA: phospholipid scramblase-related protein [Actinomycetes bacterium]